jgi:hypothetical protein
MGGDTTSTTTTMTGGQEVHARTHRPQKPALDGDAKSKTGCGRLLVLAPVGFGFALDWTPGGRTRRLSRRPAPAVGSPPRNRNPTVCTVGCSMCSCVHRRHHSLRCLPSPIATAGPIATTAHVSPAPLMRMHCTRHCPLPARLRLSYKTVPGRPRRRANPLTHCDAADAPHRPRPPGRAHLPSTPTHAGEPSQPATSPPGPALDQTQNQMHLLDDLRQDRGGAAAHTGSRSRKPPPPLAAAAAAGVPAGSSAAATATHLGPEAAALLACVTATLLLLPLVLPPLPPPPPLLLLVPVAIFAVLLLLVLLPSDARAAVATPTSSASYL